MPPQGEEGGNMADAQNIAKKYRNEAREIFNSKLGFLSHKPARSELRELMDFILERKY